MDNFDIPKIISYGVSGLGFLLAYMAYTLLSREQKKEKPSVSFLHSITLFMRFSILIAILGLVIELAKLILPSEIEPNPMEVKNNKTNKITYPLVYKLKITDSEIDDKQGNVFFENLQNLVTISKSRLNKICIVANSKDFKLDEKISFSVILLDNAGNKIFSHAFNHTPSVSDTNFWSCKTEYISLDPGLYKFSVELAGQQKEKSYRIIK